MGDTEPTYMLTVKDRIRLHQASEYTAHATDADTDTHAEISITATTATDSSVTTDPHQSSPCDTRFGIYSYGSCDDSDDYCGGYGYLDCGSNVVGTPCGRSDFDFGCGTYVYADCEGQDQASSSFGVYSPCYGRGYGYPCGGVEIRDNCNGFFGNYGSSSSSPCDTRFGIYNCGSCDDSDDYCGGYGYLDCGSNVVGTPCGRSDFD